MDMFKLAITHHFSIMLLIVIDVQDLPWLYGLKTKSGNTPLFFFLFQNKLFLLTDVRLK